jgi:hypothetical protein
MLRARPPRVTPLLHSQDEGTPERVPLLITQLSNDSNAHLGAGMHRTTDCEKFEQGLWPPNDLRDL